MTREPYPQVITDLIDRVKALTATECAALGDFWKTEEGLEYYRAGWATRWDPVPPRYPLVSHPELNEAWTRVETEAASSGDYGALDASIDAEHAAEHLKHHLHLDAMAESGALVAARSTVLAVGAHGNISEDDYKLLTSAWESVIGPIVYPPRVL